MRKLPLVLLIIWASVISWFSLFSVPTVTEKPGLLLHFASYFILAFLAMHTYSHKKALWPIIIAAISYGIILELLQGFVARNTSVADIIANTLGVLTAAIVIQNFEKVADNFIKLSLGKRKL